MQSRLTADVQFRVLPDDRIVRASHEETILVALLKAKIDLDHSCGGFGTCGTCRIFVSEGLEKLEPRNEIEEEMLRDRGFQDHERLACQTLARDEIVIRRPR